MSLSCPGYANLHYRFFFFLGGPRRVLLVFQRRQPPERSELAQLNQRVASSSGLREGIFPRRVSYT